MFRFLLFAQTDRSQFIISLFPEQSTVISFIIDTDKIQRINMTSTIVIHGSEPN